MIVDLVPRVGIPPVRMNASQIVVYNDEGTPIMVAGEFGPNGAHKVAHAGDSDFQQTLKAFGVGRHEVVVEEIDLGPVPAGVKLIGQPNQEGA